MLLNPRHRHATAAGQCELLDDNNLLLQVAPVVADETQGNGRALPFIEKAGFCNRCIQPGSQAFNQAFYNRTFLLERLRMGYMAIQHKQQDVYG